MTGLSDLEFETRNILVRRQRGVEGEEGFKPAAHLTVRGLSSEDVLRVVKIHGGAIAALFDAVQSQKIELNLDNTATLASLMLDQAPDIVADIIVVASDSTDVLADFERAKKLPMPTQLSALEAVAELTFVDQTPGEFLGAVIRMMGGMNGLLRDANVIPPQKKNA